MITDVNTEVLIIGAGPAGIAAASQVAAKGLSVTVLEKSLEIGYPVHTSGGSWTTELRELGVPERFIHPIHHLQFVSRQSESTFDYDQPEICVIDIRGTYQYLAEQASLLGAVFLTNTTAKEPLYENGVLCGVKAIRNGVPVTYRARLIIDASGFSGVIARKVGLQSPPLSYGNGAEYEMITSNWQQDMTTIMLGSSYAPIGYAWVFPYGENRVRVGIGLIAPKCKADPLKLLEDFINSPDPIAQKLRPYSIIETHLGSVPNSGYIEKSYADNLLIVGDSAGQVLGIAGEGIRLALDIGKMAGEVAVKAIQKKDTSASVLKQYETLWKKKYARSISINRAMNDIIAGFSDAKWDKVISVLGEVDPAIVLAMMKGYFDLKLLKLILTKNPGLFAYKTMQIIRKSILQK
jgi:digeranylgeranylglycerophospholipid reductase